MKTNSLTLSFRQVAATEKSPAHLIGDLRVDGARLGEGYVVDIRRLAEALTREGEHFIFTCGCGDAGCAGIFEGVQSKISGDKVSLVGSLPKGGTFSCVLSRAQACKTVVETLVTIRAVASAIESENGYPVGPEGLDASAIDDALAVLF